MKKRCLSLLLAAAMLCSMLPVQAFAEDEVPTPETAGAVEPQTLTQADPDVDADLDQDPAEGQGMDKSADPDFDTAQTSGETNAANPDSGTADESVAGTRVPAGGAVTPVTSDAAQDSEEEALVAVQSIAAPQDEPMAISEDPLPLRVSYRENGLSFYEPGTTNLITDQNNMYVALPDPVKADPTAYTYRVTAPADGGTQDFTGSQIKQTKSVSYEYAYWTYVPQKAGSYTVAILQGDEEIAKGTVEIVAVQFDTGNQGTFEGGSNTHISYYQKPTAKYSAMMDRHGKLPKVTVTGGGAEFIGWAATPGVTENDKTLPYADLWTLMQDPQATVDEGVYKAYAAYGTRAIYDFKVTRESGAEVNANTTINVKEDGTPATGEYKPEDYTLTLTIHNTGNQSLKFSPILSPSGFANVRYTGSDGSDAGLNAITVEAGKTGTITVTPKEKLSPRDYSETLTFRVEERSMLFSLTVKFSVVSSTLVVEPGALTKKYGATKSGADVTGTVIHYKNSEVQYGGTLDSLGVTLNSAGFKKNADVGNYPYTIDTSTNPAFTVELADPNALLVTVEPDTPTPSGVTASAVHTNSPLSNSNLQGTFTNSNDPETEVHGRLEWVNPAQTVGDGSSFHAEWKFTPDDTLNYNTVTGYTDVIISPKDPTVLTLTSAATVTFDGKGHEMTYTTNRGDGIAPRVEYRKRDSGEDYKMTVPIKAGVYDVKVSIGETEQYAPAEMIDTLTIEPTVITISSVYVNQKIYNGKVDNAKEYCNSVIYSGKVNNYGNVDIEFDAVYESPDAANQSRVIITMTGLTGDDKENYRLPENRVVHKYGTVKPATLTIPETNFSKTYGKLLYLQASDFDIQGLAEGDDAKITFTSQGEPADAAVADSPYPITAQLNNMNYTFSGGKNKMDVGYIDVSKAIPSGTVSAGVGKWGCELDHVSLTGVFVNPNNAEMTVPGELHWVAEPGQTLPEEGGAAEVDWEFTPQDTDNYQSATGTATIVLQAREPVHITVDPATETAVYDGKQHALGVTTDPETTVTVEYSSAQGEDWTTEAPVDAGTYTVRVTAAAVGDNAGNQIVTQLVIAPAVPNITVNGKETEPNDTSELTVPEGTPLIDALIREKFTFTDKDGKPIPGVLAWTIPEGVVTDDGQTFIWVFQPESSNFATVGGEVKFTLADDDRLISADIYNLPNASGYQDYAVVDTKNLKAGDVVTFFKDDQEEDAVSGSILVTAEDIANGRLTVWLDDDALEPAQAGTVYACISSSKKNKPTELLYKAEPDFALQDSTGADLQELTLYGDKSDAVLTKLLESSYTVLSVSISFANADNVVLLKAPTPADLQAVLRANASLVQTSMTVTVTFAFPDPARSGETISVTHDLLVTCESSGTITADLNDDDLGKLTEVTVDETETTIKDAVALEAKDREALQNGGSINYTLNVKGEDKGTVETEKPGDVEAVQACAASTLGKDARISYYMDITLNKKVLDREDKTIDNVSVPVTALPIPITVGIPTDVLTEAAKAGSNMVFAVIRVHNGVAAVLYDQDNDPKTITFSTHLFSTYAIVYYPRPIDPAPPAEPPRAEQPQSDNHSADDERDAPAAVTAAAHSRIPQTSDDSSPALWLFLFAASALGLGTLSVYCVRRRRKTK